MDKIIGALSIRRILGRVKYKLMILVMKEAIVARTWEQLCKR